MLLDATLYSTVLDTLDVSNELKSDSHLPEKCIFICFNESPLKMMKNTFYIILKSFFVLKIFKFLN